MSFDASANSSEAQLVVNWVGAGMGGRTQPAQALQPDVQVLGRGRIRCTARQWLDHHKSLIRTHRPHVVEITTEFEITSFSDWDTGSGDSYDRKLYVCLENHLPEEVPMGNGRYGVWLSKYTTEFGMVASKMILAIRWPRISFVLASYGEAGLA